MNKNYLYKNINIYNKLIIIIGIIIPLLSYKGNYNYFEKLIIILNNEWFIITNILVISLNVFRGISFYDNITFKQRTKGIINSKIKISTNVILICINICLYAISLSLVLTFLIMNFKITGNIQIILLFIKQCLIYILLHIFSTIILFFSIENFNKLGFVITNILLIIFINNISLNINLVLTVCIMFFSIVFYELFLFINRKKE